MSILQTEKLSGTVLTPPVPGHEVITVGQEFYVGMLNPAVHPATETPQGPTWLVFKMRTTGAVSELKELMEESPVQCL